MEPINESVLCIAIRQCLETADHYIRQGNRRDAQFYFDTADAYANRLIFCRQNRVNTTTTHHHTTAAHHCHPQPEGAGVDERTSRGFPKGQ